MPVEIPLTRGFVALVDEADVERVSQHRWCALKSRTSLTTYAYTRGALTQNGRKETLLHRFLIEPPSSMQVDHRDRNGLNCQRCNLRIATASQNRVNSAYSNTTTGYRGVKRNRGGTFSAIISLNLQPSYLGHFATAEEAAVAYNTAAKLLHGEFAVLNDIPEEIKSIILPAQTHLKVKGRYKGVRPHYGRFRAVLCHDGKIINLGAFETAEIAARVYDDAARRVHGLSAIVNFPTITNYNKRSTRHG